MPELPEVESIRLGLEKEILGCKLSSVNLGKHRVVAAASLVGDRLVKRWATREDRVFDGAVLARFVRRGKQLAIFDEQGRALVFRFGMTGQLLFLPGSDPGLTHTHIAWKCRGPRGRAGTLLFRDPRRFGGVVSCPDASVVDRIWKDLGPDALSITPTQIARVLIGKRSTMKRLLMDQEVIAGLGNIYVDETLFRCRMHPLMSASRLNDADCSKLAKVIRQLLRRSVRLGGSTLRDYRKPDGSAGDFKSEHLVYGRGGEPCVICKTTIKARRIAGRTTCFCPACQERR